MSDVVVPSVSESRDIAAPAAEIFSVLADPALHPRIDGTGMAQSSEHGVITKVGDVFVMNMTHWDRGDYGMENHVVEFVPDRRIVWEPRAHTYETAKFTEDESVRETRYWGWELEPLEVNLTRVTQFFDGTRLSAPLREFIEDGEFWRQGMVESLENLEQLVTAPPKSDAGSSRPRNYFREVRGSD